LQRCAAALICLVLYGGAVAGILLAIYFSWCNRENGICREAAQRPTLAERREMLESARGWEEFLFGDAMRKISWCRMTWNDLDRLERDGACPLFPLRGVPCRCGTDAWPADLKCKGPVVCTYGRLEESLRCAGPDEF
jgi:hypothetical protein